MLIISLRKVSVIAIDKYDPNIKTQLPIKPIHPRKEEKGKMVNDKNMRELIEFI